LKDLYRDLTSGEMVSQIREPAFSQPVPRHREMIGSGGFWYRMRPKDPTIADSDRQLAVPAEVVSRPNVPVRPSAGRPAIIAARRCSASA